MEPLQSYERGEEIVYHCADSKNKMRPRRGVYVCEETIRGIDVYLNRAPKARILIHGAHHSRLVPYHRIKKLSVYEQEQRAQTQKTIFPDNHQRRGSISVFTGSKKGGDGVYAYP